jgi:hypothetical protein
MTSNKLQKCTCLSVCLSFVFLLWLPSRAQTPNLLGASITGTVYFIGGFRPSRSRQFTLRIDRITSPEEVRRLEDALRSGGQDGLLREMSQMSAGRIQIGTGVGRTANVILTSPADGRTKVTVLYERDLRFGELRYGRRSADYRFGYAELFVSSGTGEGMLIPAAYVRLREGDVWEVEDFGTFPARLMGLRVRGGRVPR